MSKNGIGQAPPANGFTFGLYDELDALAASAANDKNGLVVFEDVNFDTAGTFNYTIKELTGPAGWILDSTVYPVTIEVTATDISGEFHISVSYPNGNAPNFKNIRQDDLFGLVEFPELTFDEPGTYHFTLKELSASGGGWVVGSDEYPIVITVIDDGFGNLVATADYPEGFPGFVNEFLIVPAKFVISASKRAIGAPLPAGKFQFGLFDKDGILVSTATNTAAQKSGDMPVDNDILPIQIQPVTGGSPAATLNAHQFTGSIVWTPTPVGGVFAVGTVYTASVALSPKAGFTLDGLTSASFSIDIPNTTITYNDTKLLTIVFPATVAPPVDIPVDNGIIPTAIQPVTGVTAQYNLDAAQFTGEITWQPLLVDDKFAAEETYEAKIELTAKAGYTFDGIGDWETLFSINIVGATIDDYDALTQTLTITFPKTGPDEPVEPSWSLTYTLTGQSSLNYYALPTINNWVGYDGTQVVDIPMDASYNPLDFELWVNQPGTDPQNVFVPPGSQVPFDECETGTPSSGVIHSWDWDGSTILICGSSPGQPIAMMFKKTGIRT